ncbi:hypothetical protein [Pukyongiella litopenaei]|uniref:Uncharacterized protein n=1 Tax=Pukyongiella litopenaei TaxID=2605946 RepID=A0A2S0MQF4_9RHOB|nr:hypothetical protein [Pukyongiella litopenaei]AVO37943.1 hypothetical protein C6Y53_09660 [Pukyongiella litopenaei]
MELARDLAGHVCDWLDRAADRVLDRLGSGQGELALAGDRGGRDQGPDRFDRRELATRLREAWEARHRDREIPDAAMPERDASDDLAARLREAAQGVDWEALADRAAALREGREAKERQVAEDAARERELEIEKERDSIAERDRGRGHIL